MKLRKSHRNHETDENGDTQPFAPHVQIGLCRKGFGNGGGDPGHLGTGISSLKLISGLPLGGKLKHGFRRIYG